MARGLCLYALIDCTNVPTGKRHGFVEIAVRRLAPFPDPECHAVWTASAAMVWIWPRSRMMPDEDGIPLRSERDAVYPESVYLGQPEVGGESLLATFEGVEGRIWRESLLIASRWWPQMPSLSEWSGFCRSAGCPMPEQVPPLQACPLQDRPWADHRQRSAGAWLQRLQQPIAMAMAFILASILAWHTGGLVRLAFARSHVAKETETLNERLSDILQAREHAIGDAAVADRLLALRPPMAQLPLMARIVELLRSNNGQIVEWSVPERDKLAITLRMTNPDPEALVKIMEASGVLTEVTSDAGAGPEEIVLHGRVLAAETVEDAP